MRESSKKWEFSSGSRQRRRKKGKRPWKICL